jgi:murein L,D-transpeptidase YafK
MSKTSGPKAMKRLGIAVVSFAVLAAGVVWANRPVEPLPADARADLVVVEKTKRMLTLYKSGVMLRSYHVALGRGLTGAKERAGDARTPEGRYTIDSRNAQSVFHRALHVSYPSAADRARARVAGYEPGGDVMIHGMRNGLGWLGRAHRLFDWTRGCMAVTNDEIEEIWRVVPDGTPIELRP